MPRLGQQKDEIKNFQLSAEPMKWAFLLTGGSCTLSLGTLCIKAARCDGATALPPRLSQGSLTPQTSRSAFLTLKGNGTLGIVKCSQESRGSDHHTNCKRRPSSGCAAMLRSFQRGDAGQGACSNLRKTLPAPVAGNESRNSTTLGAL